MTEYVVIVASAGHLKTLQMEKSSPKEVRDEIDAFSDEELAGLLEVPESMLDGEGVEVMVIPTSHMHHFTV